MRNTLETSVNHLTTKQGKCSKNLNQKQTIFQYLLENIATASMVTDATGIPQKNITRYKRIMELSGILWEIEKKYCQLTGFKAMYLTTDPAKANTSNKQLTLF